MTSRYRCAAWAECAGPAVHREDRYKAIDVMIHLDRMGWVYNIGGYNEMKIIDVMKTRFRALRKKESLINHVMDRKEHDMSYAINAIKDSPRDGLAAGDVVCRWHPEESYKVFSGKQGFIGSSSQVDKTCTTRKRHLETEERLNGNA